MAPSSAPTFVCDTCGQAVERVRRDVLDADYDALQKKPYWNCDSCYGKKHRKRVAANVAMKLGERHLFIIGFMATGKSKIGPILAEMLERPFIDTDEWITEAAGLTISEIFEQQGEDAFRRLENDAIARAAAESASVIALGGGAIKLESNWEIIRARGISLCVTASPQLLNDRIGRNDERPLLSGLSDDERLARITEMLSERGPYYGRADVAVESTDEQTPEETTGQALEIIREALREK